MSLHLSVEDHSLLLQGLPGNAACSIEGPALLLNALLSPITSPPPAALGQPLRLRLQGLPGARAEYPLWAIWFSPDTTGEPRFAPLDSWRAQGSPACRQSPVLAIAKAQGAWDLPEIFATPSSDLRLSDLLHERDPLGTPDGRLLLIAPQPAVNLGDTLAAALATFFHSLAPEADAIFPENALFIRSGIRSIQWNLPLPASIHLRPAPKALRARNPNPSSLRVSAPLGLQVRARWNGPFLWGAWRTQQQQERFLTLGIRGGAALHGDLSLGLEKEAENRALLHASLPHRNFSVPVSQEASSQLLDRAVRSLQRDLLRDSRIQTTLETPYGELLRIPVAAPLSLFLANAIPEPPLRDPLPGNAPDADASSLSVPPRGLCACLQSPREAQLVIGNRNKPHPLAAGGRERGEERATIPQPQTGRTNAA